MSTLLRFKNWLTGSKNWQLRLVTLAFGLPFLALAYLFKSGITLPFMFLGVVIITFIAPKIRAKLLSIAPEQAVIGIILIALGLGSIAFWPVSVLWSYPLWNNGLFVLANSIIMAFRFKPPKIPSPETLAMRQKEAKEKRKRKMQKRMKK